MLRKAKMVTKQEVEQLITDAEIEDSGVIENLIQDVISELRAKGFDIQDKDINFIRKSVMPETPEDEGLNWKSIFGLKDYKDGNDAIVDIGQKTVGQLQNVWSFYWEWEMRKLQEQQAQKLELMQTEKEIMLANENTSAQQKILIEQRFQERQKQLQEKLDKEMAERKKKQAIFEASIDFAKGLIGIWSAELSKGFLGAATAPVLTAMLAGIFAAQMAMINNQKFAGGGYTGSGSGSPDETGYKPAGIVHEGELVIDKKTLDKNNNLNPIMSLYQAMKSGQSFDKAVANYLMGNLPQNSMRTTQRASFADGGLVSRKIANSATEHVTIDFKGIRVLDPIELNQIVEIGGKRRRTIGE